MSGFEALGAAAAILQLVETGINLANKAVKLYQSSSGLESRLESLDQVTKEFQARNTELNEESAKGLNSSTPGDADETLQMITARCGQSARELVQLVEDVRMKKPTKRNALIFAWKSGREHDNIIEKQEELKNWRRECNEHMLKMILNNQSAIARTFLNVSQRQQDTQTATSTQLQNLLRNILDSLHNQSSGGHSGLPQKLRDAQNSGTLLLPREDILASLFFTQMQVRWDGIGNPTESTYSWIFNRHENETPPIRYVKWLEEEDGTFWITGKAGSGKSTLTKFIRHHPDTKQALLKWAGSRQLVIADYYFWYRGDGLQNSHEGLLRSILYKVLDQCPGLIEKVCRKRWEQAIDGRNTRPKPWTVTELQECVEALVDSQLNFEGRDVCFCFFVDGLDEYKGNSEDIIRTVEKLAAGSNIKICASSRPWNEFDFAFQSSSKMGNSIAVHLHTKEDIAIVVDAELGHVIERLGRERDELEELIADIIDMSQGVFLWVTLVIKRELVPMLKAYESVESLRKRLKGIPDDLMQYFKDIFEKVWKDTKFRAETARIFRTCITAKEPLQLECLDVVLNRDPVEYAHKATIGYPFALGQPEMIKTATAKINARCLDLLSVEFVWDGKPETRYIAYRITFLHRTVAEFLTDDDAARDLDLYSSPGFDANTTLFACYAYLVKKLPAFDHEDLHAAQSFSTQWSTMSLLYCPKTTLRSVTADLIEDINKSMELLYESCGEKGVHWTNHVASRPLDLDKLHLEHRFTFEPVHESANRDITAHLIDLDVLEDVRARLTSGSVSITNKKGRPYLDYALRWDRDSDYRRSALSQLDIEDILFLRDEDLTFDPNMVELLLSMGSDVNQKVWIYDGRTVWDLFLAFLYENRDEVDFDTALGVTKLLVNAGAKDVPRCVLSEEVQQTTAKYHEQSSHHKELSMRQVLVDVFGQDHGGQLAELVKQNTAKGWFPWPLGWP